MQMQACDVGPRRFLKNVEEGAAQGAARRACGGGNVDRFAEMGVDPCAGARSEAFAAANRSESWRDLRRATEVSDDSGKQLGAEPGQGFGVG